MFTAVRTDRSWQTYLSVLTIRSRVEGGDLAQDSILLNDQWSDGTRSVSHCRRTPVGSSLQMISA